MGLLWTTGVLTFGGWASRMMALGIQGKPLNTDPVKTVAWIAMWSLAGVSYSGFKQRQDEKYVKKLQYLVDRKERRDLWDEIYFSNTAADDE